MVAPFTYPRGRLASPDRWQRIFASSYQHGPMLLSLPTPTDPAFDWSAQGKVPPVHDQGQCGSCWDFSGCGVATCAMIQAGLWPSDGSQYFSEQYFLDCISDGGCSGDDNTTVLQELLTNGGPTSAVYGSYVGGSQGCQLTSSMPKLKIAAWGFADGSGGNGVTSTEDIKKALIAFGPVGCGVSAGGDWDRYSGGTITGRRTSINHDVMIYGWDDTNDNGDGTKGAWRVRNSWGPGWGLQGNALVAYGAESIGTETVWAQATPAPAPPTPPAPTPPPVPPTPPPPPAPVVPPQAVITAPTTALAGEPLVLRGDDSVGQSLSWQLISPAGNLEVFDQHGLAGVLAIVFNPTVGIYRFALVAQNANPVAFSFAFADVDVIDPSPVLPPAPSN